MTSWVIHIIPGCQFTHSNTLNQPPDLLSCLTVAIACPMCSFSKMATASKVSLPKYSFFILFEDNLTWDPESLANVLNLKTFLPSIFHWIWFGLPGPKSHNVWRRMTHILQRHRQSRRVRLEFSVEDGNLSLTGGSDDLLKGHFKDAVYVSLYWDLYFTRGCLI